MRQLTLSIQSNREATFENFYSGDNVPLIQCLKDAIRDNQKQFIYLFSPQVSGKTHLLQACCHLASSQQQRTFYLSLLNIDQLQPAVFSELEQFSLICIDDLQCIAGQKEWEEALFTLYNSVQEQGHSLLVAAKQAPQNLKIQLPDLVSRLRWGTVFSLRPLSNEDKLEMLIALAQQRGFELPRVVAQFLINHLTRDVNNLVAVLDKLDQASLEQKHKLTIPFVKQIL